MSDDAPKYNAQILYAGPTEPVDLCFNCKNYLGCMIKGFQVIIDDEEFYLSKEQVKILLEPYKKVKDE